MRRLVKVRKPNQITYAEAQLILNRGIRWVQQLVTDGELGITSNQHGARLSRREVEAMALRVWRRERHREGGYWCTKADAARLLGLSDQNVAVKIGEGLLPASTTGSGVKLIRRRDVEALSKARAEDPPVWGRHRTDRPASGPGSVKQSRG